jgi:hypothetical protein
MRNDGLVIYLRLGRTRHARFAGCAQHVLVGLGMVMVSMIAVVYLVTSSPGCTAESGVKLAMALFGDSVQ